MVMRYGMSDKLGPIVYGTGHDSVFLGRDFATSQNYSDKTAYDIDEEIQRIVKGAYDKVEQILKDHMEKLHFVAGFLFKNEVMEEDQFEAAMQDGEHTMEEIEALKSERRAAASLKMRRPNACAKPRKQSAAAGKRGGGRKTGQSEPDNGAPPPPKD